MRRDLVTALLLALCVLARAPGAAGAEEPAAKAAFLEGDRNFQLGKFDEAITAYERAYRLDPQPAFVFNIALAHRRQYELDGKLEHLLRARELYRNYLRLDPASPRRAGIEKILVELGAKIDAARASPGATPAPALKATPPPAGAPATPPLGPAAPGPEGQVQTGRSSRTTLYVAGGAVLVVAAVVVGALLIAAHNRDPSFDGPAIDLMPK